MPYAKQATQGGDTINIEDEVMKYNAHKRTHKGDVLQADFSGPYIISSRHPDEKSCTNRVRR